MREAVAFQVNPFGDFGGFENSLPQCGACHGVFVGELAAVAVKAYGAYLHGVRRHLAKPCRKPGPLRLFKKVVADFEGVAGLQIEEYGIQAVLLDGGKHVRADKADKEFFVARGHAI